MFHTFTRANYANMTFRRMLDNVRWHYAEQLGKPIRGFVWNSEISEKLHWHYHLCVAIDRVHFSKMPDELKFENQWGQSTGVEFVKKNVKHYMAKYFAKHNARVIGLRSFGKSRNFL